MFGNISFETHFIKWIWSINQVVLGSFLPGHQQERQKPKKQKFEHATTTFTVLPAHSFSDERTEGSYGVQKPILTSSASFHGDNIVPVSALHTKISAPESIVPTPAAISVAAAECKEQSSSKCEVSCWLLHFNCVVELYLCRLCSPFCSSLGWLLFQDCIGVL